MKLQNAREKIIEYKIWKKLYFKKKMKSIIKAGKKVNKIGQVLLIPTKIPQKESYNY